MVSNRDAKNRSRPAAPPAAGSDTGEIRLSALVPSDLRRVGEIERACFPFPWSEESLRQVLEDPETFSTLGARSSTGLLVGYIIYSEVADELHVLNVAIDPGHRRRRIATMMLMHLHPRAIARGCVHAFLEVRESNLEAQKLYAKFGYRPHGKRRDYYSENHEDAILMTANLLKAP